MKLGRHMDYHGSRAYGPDVPPSSSGSWVARHAGRLAAWTKQKLEMLLKPGADQAAELWLVRGEERHFSILGSDDDNDRRRTVASPWPVAEGGVRARRPINDR